MVLIQIGDKKGRRYYLVTGANLPNCDGLIRWVGNKSDLISGQTGESSQSGRIELWLDVVSRQRVADVDQHVYNYFYQLGCQVESAWLRE